MRCPGLKQLPSPSTHKTGWLWTEASPQAPALPGGLAYPVITIVTPSYNQAQFLEETIRSVLLQGYPALEYLIMDGGSQDGSVEIIQRYEPWIAVWESEPDRGQSHAINKGWAKATGQILHWLNSDDILLPGALNAIGQAFAQDPSLQVLMGHCLLTDVNGYPKGSKPPRDLNFEALLCGGTAAGQPAVFFSADLVQHIGLLKEHLHYGLDREYFIRISQLEPPIKVCQLSRSLACSRQWGETKSSKHQIKFFAERRQILDDIFAQSASAKIQKLRRTAYGDTYYRQAYALAESGQKKAAWNSFWQAIFWQPFPHGLKRFVKLLFLFLTKK